LLPHFSGTFGQTPSIGLKIIMVSVRGAEDWSDQRASLLAICGNRLTYPVTFSYSYTVRW